MKEFKKFIMHLKENNKLIFTLIINDFKKQYLGSYLGLFWAFAQPLTYIIVIWFVFTFGFRHGDNPDGTPFFLWLITGMIPWFFFADGFNSGTNAIISNAFLVKKVAFRVSVLPIIQIGSAFLIHMALVLFLLVAFMLYGYAPSLYWLQIIYYLLATIFLLLGLSWLTSSIRVFVKDVSNLILVIIQVGFWATPIFWQVDKIPQKYHFILNLNPMSYIIQGYRDTFINHVWFWERQIDSFYFACISLAVFVLGATVFRRLRPHFGDVL